MKLFVSNKACPSLMLLIGYLWILLLPNIDAQANNFTAEEEALLRARMAENRELMQQHTDLYMDTLYRFFWDKFVDSASLVTGLLLEFGLLPAQYILGQGENQRVNQIRFDQDFERWRRANLRRLRLNGLENAPTVLDEGFERLVRSRLNIPQPDQATYGNLGRYLTQSINSRASMVTAKAKQKIVVAKRTKKSIREKEEGVQFFHVIFDQLIFAYVRAQRNAAGNAEPIVEGVVDPNVQLQEENLIGGQNFDQLVADLLQNPELDGQQQAQQQVEYAYVQPQENQNLAVNVPNPNPQYQVQVYDGPIPNLEQIRLEHNYCKESNEQANYVQPGAIEENVRIQDEAYWDEWVQNLPPLEIDHRTVVDMILHTDQLNAEPEDYVYLDDIYEDLIRNFEELHADQWNNIIPQDQEEELHTGEASSAAPDEEALPLLPWNNPQVADRYVQHLPPLEIDHRTAVDMILNSASLTAEPANLANNNVPRARADQEGEFNAAKVQNAVGEEGVQWNDPAQENLAIGGAQGLQLGQWNQPQVVNPLQPAQELDQNDADPVADFEEFISPDFAQMLRAANQAKHQNDEN